MLPASVLPPGRNTDGDLRRLIIAGSVGCGLMRHIIVCSWLFVLTLSFGRAAATVSGRSFADGDLRRHFLITAGDLVNSSSAAALPAALSLAVADELFNYTLQLRKGRPADICRSFVRIRTTNTTGAISATTSRHLSAIVDMLQCACVDRKASCRRQIDCFEREYSGPLCRLCDERLTFNVAQNTQLPCKFSQEAADCQVSLVQSACGHGAGSFSFHLTALLGETSRPLGGALLPKLSTCQIQNTARDYSGFRYDANCPPIFVDDLEVCAARHIENNLLQFRADYDLIAITDNPETIVAACRSFREYRLCVRPIKKSCPRGVQMIYDYDTPLRLYHLKMDYICSKQHRRTYVAHLPCYQEILSRRQDSAESPTTWSDLRPCELLWQRRLKPAFDHVTAYQYYCNPSSSKTSEATRLVRQLSACYEASFGAKCGRDAGKLVSGLVDRAFDDPRYTRYRHRPDCRLHRHVDDDNRLGAMTNASAATAYDTSSSSPSASSSRQRHIRRHRTGGTEKRQAPPPVDGASADALEAERFDAAVPEALSSLDIDQRLSPADLDLDYVPSELSEMENAVDDATSCGCVTVSASSMTIGFVSAATVLFEITAMCSLR